VVFYRKAMQVLHCIVAVLQNNVQIHSIRYKQRFPIDMSCIIIIVHNISFFN